MWSRTAGKSLILLRCRVISEFLPVGTGTGTGAGTIRYSEKSSVCVHRARSWLVNEHSSNIAVHALRTDAMHDSTRPARIPFIWRECSGRSHRPSGARVQTFQSGREVLASTKQGHKHTHNGPRFRSSALFASSWVHACACTCKGANGARSFA